jgi:hypothetical protein
MACWDEPDAMKCDMLLLLVVVMKLDLLVELLLLLVVMLVELVLKLLQLPAACCASNLASLMADGMSNVSTPSSACGTMFKMALSPYRKETTLL